MEKLEAFKNKTIRFYINDMLAVQENLSMVRSFVADQVAVNRYVGTAGIAAHVEDVEAFGPQVATLSLLRPIELTLSDVREAKDSRERPGDGRDHGNWAAWWSRAIRGQGSHISQGLSI